MCSTSFVQHTVLYVFLYSFVVHQALYYLNIASYNVIHGKNVDKSNTISQKMKIQVAVITLSHSDANYQWLTLSVNKTVPTKMPSVCLKGPMISRTSLVSSRKIQIGFFFLTNLICINTHNK